MPARRSALGTFAVHTKDSEALQIKEPSQVSTRVESGNREAMKDSPPCATLALDTALPVSEDDGGFVDRKVLQCVYAAKVTAGNEPPPSPSRFAGGREHSETLIDTNRATKSLAVRPQPSEIQPLHLSSKTNSPIPDNVVASSIVPTLDDQPAPTVDEDGDMTTNMEKGRQDRAVLTAQALKVWKPDMYAESYVPLWLHHVNEAPAISIVCQPFPTQNLQDYTLSFAAVQFLPPLTGSIPPPIQAVPIRLARHTCNLTFENYGEYFEECLRTEAMLRASELKTLSLYDASLRQSAREKNLYHLKVPGLREGLPRVELSDIVIIRVLNVYPGVEQRMTEWTVRGGQHTGSCPPGAMTAQISTYACPPVSGSMAIEYNAVVWGLSRAREELVLRIDNCRHTSLQCNVHFRLQQASEARLWDAQATATSALVPLPPSLVQHEAAPLLPKSRWLRQMLFPEPGDQVMQYELSKGVFSLDFYDRSLNYEQQKAIDSIVCNAYGNIPYLISGPPGTGKTKTIVECALQLLLIDTHAQHILICAPSDSAADTITSRLARNLGPKELLRLNSPTRSFAEVPSTILPYTYADTELFSLPVFETLMEYKVVVTSCRDSALLVAARVTNADLMQLHWTYYQKMKHTLGLQTHPFRSLYHWTALLFDEAAQATEPETLISLSVVNPLKHPQDISVDKEPQVVLVADYHQLGPKVSPLNETALDTSLFERLFQRDIYAKHPLSRKKAGPMGLTSSMLPIPRPAFAVLTRNYRSHPAIIAMPSVLFYNDTLIPERGTASTPLIPTNPMWQTHRPWPVIFSINRELDTALDLFSTKMAKHGPALVNSNETYLALRYAQDLLHHRHAGSPDLQQHEIAIMSPFPAQVALLRDLFRRNNLYQVNIGPLEAFQGLESRIVIFCTTRTRIPGVEGDIRRGMGVINERKRFNVAMTRAKEGLIVIGDPNTLLSTRDECWQAFLAFCARNMLIEWRDLVSNTTDTADYEALVGSMPTHFSSLEQGLLFGERLEIAERGGRRLGGTSTEDEAMWTAGLAAEKALMEDGF